MPREITLKMVLPEGCEPLEGGGGSDRVFIACGDTEFIAGIYVESASVKEWVTPKQFREMETAALRMGLSLMGREYKWWLRCDETVERGCIEKILNFFAWARERYGLDLPTGGWEGHLYICGVEGKAVTTVVKAGSLMKAEEIAAARLKRLMGRGGRVVCKKLTGVVENLRAV